jgi:tRNA-dihydrouridine synthase A
VQHVDGVMVGRAAYQTPYILAEVDRRFFDPGANVPTRREAIEGMHAYVERHLAGGGRLNNVVRHVLGLYHGVPRARLFRRHLSENAPRCTAGLATLHEAVAIAEAYNRPLAAAE